MLKTLLICVEAVDADDQLNGFFVDWLLELERQEVKAIVLCLRRGRMPSFHSHEIIELPRRGALLSVRRLVAIWCFSWKRRREYQAVFVRQAPIFVVTSGFLWRMLGKRVLLWYAHYTGTMMLHAAEIFAHVIVTSVPEACRLKWKTAQPVGQSIDTSVFDIDPKKTFDGQQMITLGRGSPVKKITEVIRRFAESHLAERGAHLTIAGRASDPAYAEQVTQAIAQTKNVTWRQEGVPHHELPAFLKTADIVVNLYTGSLDKAILECMASGVIPVIATDAAEGVLPADLHWLIARTPEKQQGAIDRILTSRPDERRGIATSLRQIVEQEHALATQVSRIVKIVFERV